MGASATCRKLKQNSGLYVQKYHEPFLVKPVPQPVSQAETKT
ncbi:hypothetical protein L917_21496 [Phytophthora nicotianae]|uniref:Uncharacterized protein n=1 Tax=Phytophthora nicotianae TaxID=4792 RepID=W2IMU7_PHYNI|nr:hypothetical protein L915_13059 [Phytophthora nicotianae]ETL34857.1 hypothetical protein L916_12960 [Phytophthora nicotianae]ETL77561.1 hypothetical protein L917_21496 [Phytophthora nicotianae]